MIQNDYKGIDFDTLIKCVINIKYKIKTLDTITFT